MIACIGSLQQTLAEGIVPQREHLADGARSNGSFAPAHHLTSFELWEEYKPVVAIQVGDDLAVHVSNKVAHALVKAESCSTKRGTPSTGSSSDLTLEGICVMTESFDSTRGIHAKLHNLPIWTVTSQEGANTWVHQDEVLQMQKKRYQGPGRSQYYEQLLSHPLHATRYRAQRDSTLPVEFLPGGSHDRSQAS